MAGKKGKNTARTVVSFIFSFFLSLLLLVGTAFVLVRVGAFEHRSFRSMMDDDYYRAVLDNFVAQAEDYTLPTNIDTSVLKDVFMLDEAKRDINGFVKNAFAGLEYVPNTEAAEQRLRENLHRFFNENEVELGDDKEAVCEEYIKEIFELYAKKMRMPGIEVILRVRTKYVKLVNIAIIVSFALAAVLAFVLIRLHRGTREGLRYVSYSTLAAALMAFAAPAWVYFTGRYRALNLAPEYFYRFVTGYLKHMLELCFFTAGIWALVTLCIFVIMGLARQRSREDQTELSSLEE